eukprot:gnl/TRDRNA2_/TRDRNA2_189432_c0_seq1.p1 gnl/TRDRNA2_/TRDRNA2_189432_c0~~gnl/TRDRNA2_/TRDRNA2_189432_c0_seq1.p1  ORF type:complete len:200 (+),score=30.79 gnl/TRDRNA2_/TRDRNA2_189432_c0_seq1:91-690(+)
MLSPHARIVVLLSFMLAIVSPEASREVRLAVESGEHSIKVTRHLQHGIDWASIFKGGSDVDPTSPEGQALYEEFEGAMTDIENKCLDDCKKVFVSVYKGYCNWERDVLPKIPKYETGGRWRHPTAWHAEHKVKVAVPGIMGQIANPHTFEQMTSWKTAIAQGGEEESDIGDFFIKFWGPLKQWIGADTDESADCVHWIS